MAYISGTSLFLMYFSLALFRNRMQSQEVLAKSHYQKNRKTETVYFDFLCARCLRAFSRILTKVGIGVALKPRGLRCFVNLKMLLILNKNVVWCIKFLAGIAMLCM